MKLNILLKHILVRCTNIMNDIVVLNDKYDTYLQLYNKIIRIDDELMKTIFYSFITS